MTVGPHDPGAATEDLPRRALQRAFALGAWRRVEPLAGGKSQHHLVDTDRGRFVLRRSYRAKEADGIRFEHELVAHLRAGGFPAPELVPTVTGDACAEIDGRLWRVSVFVPGRAADGGNPAHVDAVAGALARYHDLVESFVPSVPAPDVALVPAALRERIDAVVALRAAGPPDGTPPALVASIAGTLAEADAAAARLGELYATLARLVVHAGCRRGSTLFDGDRLVCVLDFDSAHLEVRALDVAVAVFDFAKVYGDPAGADYKVHVDPSVAARFLDAYSASATRPLGAEEHEAVRLLIVAKRLKRALGRYRRLFEAEPLSANDLRKIALELDRVRSLESRWAGLPAGGPS